MSRSVVGSTAYQHSLTLGLAALHDPIIDDLPSVLGELQQSTQLMQEQQEQFLYRLRAAQSEIQNLRNQLEKAQMAATLDSLTQVFNRHAFTRLLEQALASTHEGLALVMLDIDHFKQFNDHFGHPLGTACCSMSASCCANSCHPVPWRHATAARSSAWCCGIATTWPPPTSSPKPCARNSRPCG